MTLKDAPEEGKIGLTAQPIEGIPIQWIRHWNDTECLPGHLALHRRALVDKILADVEAA